MGGGSQISDKNQRTKYLLVGSGPEVETWISKHLQWFVLNDYKILTFNNSWKIVPLHHIFEYFNASDSKHHCTFIPSEIEKKQINKKTTINQDKCIRDLYCILKKNPRASTTMFFDVLYYLHAKHAKHGDQFSVAVVGCNLIYKKKGDTFYSHLPISKATNDPVNKFTDKELSIELSNVQKLYDSRSCDIWNASTMEGTRLPFKRFHDYLWISQKAAT
jgi:hypothetical protein